jgi:hypothetical protein
MDSSQFGQESSLYLTREELQAAEARGEGAINWSKFDELIAKNREEMASIENAPTEPVNKRERNFKIYVYSLQGQLLDVCDTTKQASDKYDVGMVEIARYSKQEIPYYKKQLLFSRRILGDDFKWDFIEKVFTTAAKQIYAYNATTKELIGKYDTYKDAAEATGVPINHIRTYVSMDRVYKKANIYFSKSEIIEWK